MLTETQKKERLLGIGGSDVGYIAGYSQYKTPLEVYLIKTGQIEDDEVDNESIEVGNDLEEYAINKYASRRGVKIQRPKNAIVHPEYYWMRCNLDFVVEGTSIIGEAKTTGYLNEHWGTELTDDMPDHFQLQCAHNAIVSEHIYGTTEVHVPVFSGGFGGLKHRVYIYKRNPKLESKIIEMERAFWQEHVEKMIPPTPSSLKEARIRWPEAQNQPKIASLDVLEALDTLKEIQSQMKRLEDIEDAKKTVICNYLGDEANILLDHEGSKLASWNNENRSRLDIDQFKKDYPDLYEKYLERSTNRVFRLSKQKRAS